MQCRDEKQVEKESLKEVLLHTILQIEEVGRGVPAVQECGEECYRQR